MSSLFFFCNNNNTTSSTTQRHQGHRGDSIHCCTVNDENKHVCMCVVYGWVGRQIEGEREGWVTLVLILDSLAMIRGSCKYTPVPQYIYTYIYIHTYTFTSTQQIYIKQSTPRSLTHSFQNRLFTQHPETTRLFTHRHIHTGIHIQV